MGGWPLGMDEVAGRLALAAVPDLQDSDCERFGEGFWGQPANSTTSLAFVAAGIAIAATNRTEAHSRPVFGGLVVATGIGSVIQHGPHPAWADLAHDLPLVALIAYLAVDAASDLSDRRLPATWWAVPTLAAIPLITAGRDTSTLTQGVLAAIAIGLSLQRARLRASRRRALVGSMVLLGVGSLVGTLSRTGWPLCRPDSLLQGHAFWHLMAALAMWWLAPAVGQIHRKSAHVHRV